MEYVVEHINQDLDTLVKFVALVERTYPGWHWKLTFNQDEILFDFGPTRDSDDADLCGLRYFAEGIRQYTLVRDIRHPFIARRLDDDLMRIFRDASMLVVDAGTKYRAFPNVMRAVEDVERKSKYPTGPVTQTYQRPRAHSPEELKALRDALTRPVIAMSSNAIDEFSMGASTEKCIAVLLTKRGEFEVNFSAEQTSIAAAVQVVSDYYNQKRDEASLPVILKALKINQGNENNND